MEKNSETYKEKNFETLAKNLKNNIARRKVAKTSKQEENEANKASQSDQQ